MTSVSVGERESYIQRIDSLLDELTETRRLLAMCAEIEDASSLAISAGVEIGDRLLTMQRFVEACERTNNYRPHPFELRAVLGMQDAR